MSIADALIVGAGPTGLALACGLRIQGAEVIVIDSAPGPAVTSRALALQPRGAEVLQRLGALGELPDRALPPMRMNLNDRDTTFLSVHLGGQAKQTPGQAEYPLLLISQAEVEKVLRNRLAELGTEVFWGTELRDLHSGEDAATATMTGLEGERSVIDAAWVIGCDGAHSVVRKRAGISFPGKQVIDRSLLADVRADWPLDRSGSNSWLSSNGTVAMMPLPNDMWRVFVSPPDGFPDEPSESEIVRAVGSAVAEVTDFDDSLIRSVEWTSMFRVHRRLATSYRRGRILLAGDAAHIHSPTGGQGMNMGIGDGENLAWKLGLVLGGRAGIEVLDTYEAERRPVAAATLRGTTGATRLLLSRSRAGQAVRNRLVAPLARVSAVQRRIDSAMSQLRISYRDSPLNGQSGGLFRRGPQPGDRLPDVTCRCRDGQPTHLYSVLNGGWAVLASDAQTAALMAEPVAERLGCQAVSAVVPDRPELCGGLRIVLIIRPDGHVGWRGPAVPEKVRAWLDAVKLGK